MINYEDYINLARKVAGQWVKSSSNTGWEYDDIFQQCMMVMVEKSKYFDETKGNFSTFIVTCWNNEILKEMLRDNKFIPAKGKDRVSKEAKIFYYQQETNEDGQTFLNSFGEWDRYSIFEKESLEEVKAAIRKLTDREKKILILRSKGYKQADIAKEIGVMQPQIGKILVQIKNKLINCH